MTYPPMCGRPTGEECSDCSSKKKRCYCYRINDPELMARINRVENVQLPEGD